jgi:biotin operon repressor
MQNQTSKIKNILLYGVGKNKLKHSVELIQREFGISKQAVNKHLLNLEKDGYLIANGTTRNKTYKLGEIRSILIKILMSLIFIITIFIG